MSDATTPVIVGIGSVLDRPEAIEKGRPPLELVIEAVKRADKDSGGKILSQSDTLSSTKPFSWKHNDYLEQLAERLGLQPRTSVEGGLSGNTPVYFLCRAAQRVARGQSQVELICGGESSWTLGKALKQGLNLDWEGQSFDVMAALKDYPKQELQYGLIHAVNGYALFENAYRHAKHQSFDENTKQSASLWSRFSQIAANSPHAWIRKEMSADDIASAGASNRMLSWPYRKFMVANNTVNGATAILVTNLAVAKKAGIPEEKLIYIESGALAHEPSKDLLGRDHFHGSQLIETILSRLVKEPGLRADDIDHTDIYSCFPIVVKLAQDFLGWPTTKDLTVMGGMTFGGAQFTNYPGQACVAMVEKLRDNGQRGLLYGNGGVLTYGGGLILTKDQPTKAFNPDIVDLQSELEHRTKGNISAIDTYQGDATLETYTVVFHPDGTPDKGIVLGLTTNDERLCAFVTQPDGIDILLNKEHSPIGKKGVVHNDDGTNMWTFDVS